MDVPCFRLACEDLPLRADLSTVIGTGTSRTSLSVDGETMVLEDVRSRWFRRFAPPALPVSLRPRDRQFAEGEVAALLNGSILEQEGGFAVNDRDAERRASGKLHQLRTADAVGLRVPQTLVTNDPAAVRRFVEEADGQVLFKPVSGFAPNAPDLPEHASSRYAAWGDVATSAFTPRKEREVVFARLLGPEELSGLAAVRLAPVTFQRFIPKSADIRVTIVGREIFACRILSQATPATAVDFRRMVMSDDAQELRHEICDLPPATEAALRGLMQRLGLAFGCVDLVEEVDGTLTFLEINPSGQWLWIEQRTAQPISERLAAMLARASVE